MLLWVFPNLTWSCHEIKCKIDKWNLWETARPDSSENLKKKSIVYRTCSPPVGADGSDRLVTMDFYDK